MASFFLPFPKFTVPIMIDILSTIYLKGGMNYDERKETL